MGYGNRQSNAGGHRNDLYSALISDIKTYSGKDPLFPWLRGIKTLKESLPSELLIEKLPRFLQKCTQKFESDRRYRNDVRYLRIWLQLMDYVDDPSLLLRTMETNRIGKKRSLFYQAYGLYYEKIKKFEEADKMYHLGVQNLAEPVGDLKKAYEQFLRRMERYKHKREKLQERKFTKKSLSCRIPQEYNEVRNKDGIIRGEDTIVASFVDTAIVGKPEAEDARHHGLIEPTINLKDAINDINSMFREPIEIVPPRKGSQRGQQKDSWNPNNGFTVFVDENVEKHHKGENSSLLNQRTQTKKTPLEIYMDGEDNCESGGMGDNEGLEQNQVQDNMCDSVSAFVFPFPKDLSPESCDRPSAPPTVRGKFRGEDTVVRRFVGSAILDEPEVENACHHGLVDPTVNLKEAMDDINNMFGKPIDFIRRKRSKNPDRAPEEKQACIGFSILADNDDDDDGSHSFEQERCQVPQKHPSKAATKEKNDGFSIFLDDDVKLLPTGKKSVQQKSSGRVREGDLFEPTVFTKEARDDINQLFKMPIDF